MIFWNNVFDIWKRLGEVPEMLTARYPAVNACGRSAMNWFGLTVERRFHQAINTGLRFENNIITIVK